MLATKRNNNRLANGAPMRLHQAVQFQRDESHRADLGDGDDLFNGLNDGDGFDSDHGDFDENYNPGLGFRV